GGRLGGVAVAGGNHPSLAVRGTGEWWGGGTDNNDSMGNGQPLHYSGPTNIVRAAAGSDFSLALASDGTVWSWGANESSQLGDGTSAAEDDPLTLSEPAFAWRAGTPVFAPPAGGLAQPGTVTITS